MNQKLSFILVLVAGVLWGTTGTSQTFAPMDAHPIAIGSIRLAIGGGSLLLLVLLFGKLHLKDWPLKPTLVASLSMACYQPLFFTAVTITGVAIGTVIAIGSAPILSGLLEWLFWKKRPSRVWWYSTILSIIGCTLLFVNPNAIQVNISGVIMALGAGLSFACYTLASESLVKRDSSLAVVAVVFSISAVFLSPFLFIYELSWLLEPSGMAVSLHLGIVTTGFAYFLFAKGLKHISASTAVTLSLAEPLTAALLGVFLVGERLSMISWVGLILLIIGISLLVLYSNKVSDASIVHTSDIRKNLI
ncbi:EamA family transporter [Cytobacillus spongiae]|uniref:EamA family transporter n=1 Tax=Cytobacillus spongiae TaxID=2901381 RepID=UPI001F476990|nr:EamA family transporter [Cytobacillus spongiae]UII55232.1 EamA family transporter [Cytobacillus spongiae]